MSGNRGLNGNQNHCLKNHNSTRVLAPPGGASSFSIGGYGGGTEAPRPRKQTQRATAPEPSYNRPPIQQQCRQQAPPAQHYNDRRPRSNSDDVGNDALDSHMDRKINRSGGIPGLEGHYSQGNQAAARNNSMGDSYGSASGNFHGRSTQGKMSSNQYADALREQIDAKRNSNENSYNSRRNTQNNCENTNEQQFGSGSTSFTSQVNQGNARGVPNKMSGQDYADALRDQINCKRNHSDGGLTTSIGRSSFNKGKQYQEGPNNKENDQYSASEDRSRGSIKINNAPGGNSSFQLY